MDGLSQWIEEWETSLAAAENWVEQQGGSPPYMKRIRKHLERKGMDKSHAYAVSVNVAKKMCATGDVNWPGLQHVNPGSQAEACAAVARWEQMKASSHGEALRQMEAIDAMTLTEAVDGEGVTPVGDMLRDLPKPTELTESTPFGEAIRKASGKKMRVRLISPGWGSSGHYSEAMLKETAANGVFKAGSHMYADHPTADQNEARPERSIKDLAAVTTSPGVWDGDGVYADVETFPGWTEALAAMKDHIGVSIRALGMAEQGEADGVPGTIISELSEIKSVDFVTRAGRGGQITALLESARQVSEGTTTTGGPVSGTETQGTPATGTPNTLNEGVTNNANGLQFTIPGTVTEAEKQVSDLQRKLAEATATLEVRNDAVHQAAESKRLLGEAQTKIARLSATETARSKTQTAFAESKLPDVCAGPVIARVLGHEGGALPLTEANTLDDAKLTEAIKASVKAEETYVAQIAEALGVGAPKGLGGGTSVDMTDAQFEEALSGMFQRTGTDKKTADQAAKGR